MSIGTLVLPQHPSPFDVVGARKRTSSFSLPTPSKAPRTATSSLKRTTSYLLLPQFIDAPPSFQAGTSTRVSPSPTLALPLPKPRGLVCSKETPKDKRGRLPRTYASLDLTISIAANSRTPPPALPALSPLSMRFASPVIASSPVLASSLSRPRTPPTAVCASGPATRRYLPPRTHYPKAKPSTDLYRKALLTHMRGSPEGQKILLMGPRAAVSMLNATRDLEALVAAADMDFDGDGEVVSDSPDPWVVVPDGERADWDMLDAE